MGPVTQLLNGGHELLMRFTTQLSRSFQLRKVRCSQLVDIIVVLLHLTSVGMLCRMSTACSCKTASMGVAFPRLSRCCAPPWRETDNKTGCRKWTHQTLVALSYPLQLLCSRNLHIQHRLWLLPVVSNSHSMASTSGFVTCMSNHIPLISMLSSSQRLWVCLLIDDLITFMSSHVP
jgi:hypothetical protein